VNTQNELRRKVAAVNMHPNRNLMPLKEPTKRYLICSTPRSGSTLLADLLDKTSFAGRPLEYFNNVYVEDYARTSNTPQLARQKYWSDLQRMRTTENGVFGVKAHLTQVQQWLGTNEISTIGKFLSGFEHLIFIRRRDKLG
jgi:LPS sulfotransferase NodH